MSFLQREYDKLHQLCTTLPQGNPTYDLAYLAKQTLAWAMEPDAFASPSSQLQKWHGAKIDATAGTGVSPGALNEPLPSAPPS